MPMTIRAHDAHHIGKLARELSRAYARQNVPVSGDNGIGIRGHKGNAEDTTKENGAHN